jgi:hypothetical protein
MTRPPNAAPYEADFVAWLEDQARRARGRELDGLDFDNIAEELEGLARSDRREIRNRPTVLLTHLLKCWVKSGRRSSSWLGTITEQREEIAQLIEESPSLSAFPAEILERCYPAARRKAAEQMRLREGAFSDACPFCDWRNSRRRLAAVRPRPGTLRVVRPRPALVAAPRSGNNRAGLSSHNRIPQQ